ncbi:chaperone protein dnaJ 11 chloroplastic-like [Prunus yedoensis var. nudiflora]|uniref:Chaperone protein dnaJ 11 chloroplastic-like n=1 Tax=Prunus yedoensis var. nudiflora TaxID=2094558 RepID=A0A314YG57_PRUYE|nr:chaperone protein dnaJ 11 chloroplastic-like [Prunus yedoensis var. nudiflora]
MAAVSSTSTLYEVLGLTMGATYATLSDPDKRANYDRDLYRCPQPFRSSSYSSASMAAAASAMAGSSRRTYRNWETDQCW